MLLIDQPMPEGCDVCPFNYDFCMCQALKEECDDDDAFGDENFDWTKRPDWCPLAECNDPYEIKVQQGLRSWTQAADRLLKRK